MLMLIVLRLIILIRLNKEDRWLDEVDGNSFELFHISLSIWQLFDDKFRLSFLEDQAIVILTAFKVLFLSNTFDLTSW